MKVKMTTPMDITEAAGFRRLSGQTGEDTQSASATDSKPGIDFEGDVKVSNKLPTVAELKKVADLPVLDAGGKSQPFKNIYSGEKATQRVLVIFVRHFFCGVSPSPPPPLTTSPDASKNCQEYLRTLSSSLRPDALLALPTPTQIVVIGCGHPDLISMYRQTTACPFPIYADPTRKLYDHLGMTRTLDLGPSRPEYMQKSLLYVMLASFVQSLKSGWGAIQGGDYRQVGGEFLFDDGNVTWGHRMRNTRDHAEIPALRNVLGLDATRPPLRKTWTSGVGRALSNRRRSWSRSSSRTRKGGGSRRGSVMEEVAEENDARSVGDGVGPGDAPLRPVGHS